MSAKRMKILIAYDGSEHSDAALDDLRRAGLPAKARAVALSVADVWIPPGAIPLDEPVALAAERSTGFITRRANYHRLRAERRLALKRAGEALREVYDVAERAAEQVKSFFPEWEVRAEASVGSPAARIIRRAHRWKADLIVVGSQGRSALGRFFLGSVSQQALTEARCSVRIARRRNPDGDSPARIVIGVDGREGSDIAVNAVAARAWPAGSEVRLIAAYELIRPTIAGYVIPALTEWTEERTEEEAVWARQLVRDAKDKLEAAGLAVSSVAQPGDPKRMLIEEAENWGADCIFAGARGVSGIERCLLGSVSAAVAARASCSVEIARPARTT